MFRKSKRRIERRDTNPVKFRKDAILTFAVFAFGLFLLAVPVIVFAQVDLGLDQAANIGLTTTDIRTVIARIINAFFGLLGLIIVILYMYGGFLWMTAAGDAGRVDQAKRVMINATIGLVIVLSAYAIAFFIIRAVTGVSILPGGFGGTRPPPSGFSSFRSGSSGELGNGIIEYHYPEAGQTDVARNTNIAITFKKPYLLSTVIADYDAGDDGEGNPTFTLDDDTVGGVPLAAFLADPDNRLMLNTDNFKIIDAEALGDVAGDTPDDRFDSRYPEALAATVRFTDVNPEFDPLEGQTIVIDPIELLGSSLADIDYRVAIRGGDNGVQVWSPDPASGEPVIEPAFDAMNAEGGYYWPFTTGTTVDLTPPRITSVVPRTFDSPADGEIPRNQLLQIYFNEPVDPTTASGILGAGGFTNIEVKARCLPDRDCGGWPAVLETVPGTLYIGNKYRTVEFVPDNPCEGVRENTCGEPVFCLPANTEIRVRTLASTLAAEPPAGLGDGVQDMVGNSLDGNDNGTSEGPTAGDLVEDFYFNLPQDDLDGVSDTAYWLYRVGTLIDLTPPAVYSIDPVSHDVQPGETGGEDDPLPPEQYPVDRDITAVWSKVMSVSSMRTGGYLGGDYVFTDDRTTIALRAQERLKADFNEDCTDPAAPCTEAEPPLDPPWFQISVGDGPVEIDGIDRTVMRIEHRTLFTANDLGYNEEEIGEHPDFIPIYAPVLGARIRDTRQNCFYPSVGYGCSETGPGATSCCDREARESFGGSITCD